MRVLYSIPLICCCGFSFVNCGNKQENAAHTIFTKADSLTEIYLTLHDSLLQTWNVMINDDNQKIKAMHNLLHELMVTHPEELEIYTAYKQRLDQLTRLRYTQKSMMNADVIEEYDLASGSLIDELITHAESKKQFAYNTTLQKLVNQILSADERMLHYRNEYDSIVSTYNAFIEKNTDYLLGTDLSLTLDKKPSFQATTE